MIIKTGGSLNRQSCDHKNEYGYAKSLPIGEDGRCYFIFAPHCAQNTVSALASAPQLGHLTALLISSIFF